MQCKKRHLDSFHSPTLCSFQITQRMHHRNRIHMNQTLVRLHAVSISLYSEVHEDTQARGSCKTRRKITDRRPRHSQNGLRLDTRQQLEHMHTGPRRCSQGVEASTVLCTVLCGKDMLWIGIVKFPRLRPNCCILLAKQGWTAGIKAVLHQGYAIHQQRFYSFSPTVSTL